MTPVRLITVFQVHQGQSFSAVRANQAEAVTGDGFEGSILALHISIITEYGDLDFRIRSVKRYFILFQSKS
jgi:hypothetical protein